MLETVLMYLNNWFVVGRYDDTYTIEDSGITLPFLKKGQYFRIVGSLFNDGVYQYPAELTDEAFNGSVWALAIPKALLSTVEEITAWTDKNGDSGPYTSESFGGYSYSKATNSKGLAVGWRDVFAAQLAPWKKPAGSWQYANPNPHMTPPEPHKDNPWGVRINERWSSNCGKS